MKNYILLYWMLCASALCAVASEKLIGNPFVAMNTVRDWGDISEVVRAYKQLSECSSVPEYGFEEQRALSYGIRQVERLFGAVTSASGADTANRLATALLKGKSLTDIALVGATIELGETVKFQGDSVARRVSEMYFNQNIASDIMENRREALRIIELLLNMKGGRVSTSASVHR